MDGIGPALGSNGNNLGLFNDLILSDEDSQLSQAIMASMNPQDSIDTIACYEPLNAEQRIRQGGDIAGLKNIGNTCYFNSILQVYYNMPDFVRSIMEFKDDEQINITPIPDLDQEEKALLFRLEQSKNLIKYLKILFAEMAIGDSKYVDPTKVLKSITDDSGKVIELGNQKDIGEFNDSFLSRVQEGLNHHKIYKKFLKIKKKKKAHMQSERDNAAFDDLDDNESVADLDSSICLDDIEF